MHENQSLTVVNMGINTHQEPIAYMHKDCHICRAEGFSANSRILVNSGDQVLLATLDVVENHILLPGEIGLSNIALERLGVIDGDEVFVGHAPVVTSLSLVRKKIYGHALSNEELQLIMEDISAHRYRDVEIASFLSACAGNRMNVDEITGMTKAMVSCGEKLTWPGKKRIFDKHCIGGLPGNRTTPLVVAIASAAGLVMPKTSSRSITSPAGTADTMETLFNVSFSIREMQDIVNNAGACMVWGGAVSLSPADDLMVRVEKELELDSQGQLIASVLSKKISAGATHVVIDIPVGDTAKVRSLGEADYLAGLFTQVAADCGIHVRCVITDGSKPVGAGIGPMEEARDLLAVLQGQPGAPNDLRQRGVELAANLLDMAEGEGIDKARAKAASILEDGRAWVQFQRIAAAQGGLKTLKDPNFSHTQYAGSRGLIVAIDNRRLSRLAKLAGAPGDPTAGLRLHANAGSFVEADDPLFTLFTDSAGERDYAMDYFSKNKDMFLIKGDK